MTRATMIARLVLMSVLAASVVGFKGYDPSNATATNIALGKPVLITTNGANENHLGSGVSPTDVTDGSLDYLPASSMMEDGVVGYVNVDYNQLMRVTVTINLQGTFNISRIRYNMGNVERAETWNADKMTTPFGVSATVPGAPYSSAWTEHAGNATTSSVIIVLEKTRTIWSTDLMFIGEIEIYGTPSDNGFRPYPNGYSFANYSGEPEDFDINDMRRMVGDNNVCMTENCSIVRPGARRKQQILVQSVTAGQCFGMAVSSLNLFVGPDKPSDLQQNKTTTYDIDYNYDVPVSNSVRHYISYYFVKQYLDPLKSYIALSSQQDTPKTILNLLKSSISNKNADSIVLFMVRKPGNQGHVVTPYALEDKGDGNWWIWVYDNNHPYTEYDDAAQYLVINTINDTWIYDHNNIIGIWSGTADEHTIGVVSLSQVREQSQCPSCQSSQKENAVLDSSGSLLESGLNQGEVWLSGSGHLLIKNSGGQRIGYVGDQIVNEIPTAYMSPRFGGLGVNSEPIYNLPLSSDYTLLLDGNNLNETGSTSVTLFGSGYSTSVDNIAINSTSQHSITVTPDGYQTTFHSDDITTTPNFIITQDRPNYGYEFRLKNVDVGQYETVKLTIDPKLSNLIFSNVDAGGGVYDILIDRFSTSGEQIFVYNNVTILAGDTHYLDYESWIDSDSMALSIDSGSDGTIDTTIVLRNQVSRVYLPITVSPQ